MESLNLVDLLRKERDNFKGVTYEMLSEGSKGLISETQFNNFVELFNSNKRIQDKYKYAFNLCEYCKNRKWCLEFYGVYLAYDIVAGGEMNYSAFIPEDIPKKCN
jgi:hypothetical protein